MSSVARKSKTKKKLKHAPALRPASCKVTQQCLLNDRVILCQGRVDQWLPRLVNEGFACHGCFCDPPYHLNNTGRTTNKVQTGFMRNTYDGGDVSFRVETWRSVMDCLLPGSHMLTFGGTRTYHRMACAIEDAGFEIRDMTLWLHGTGFPKSLDVSKAIDAGAGAVRPVVGKQFVTNAAQGIGIGGKSQSFVGGKARCGFIDVTAAATEDAKTWDGYGTALKPAVEPLVLARVPLAGTVANNVKHFGTGALNIDACRIGDEPIVIRGGGAKYYDGDKSAYPSQTINASREGRYPANVVLSHHPCCRVEKTTRFGQTLRKQVCHPDCPVDRLDRGGDELSRFFFCPKASASERDAGMHGVAVKRGAGALNIRSDAHSQRNGMDATRRNDHATVKPIKLCKYLATLLLPPKQECMERTLLVPFAGTGSEAIGALLAGWDRVVLVESSPKWCAYAAKRLRHWCGG